MRLGSAEHQAMPTYDYRAKIVEVVDGDTVKTSVRLYRSRAAERDLGFHVFYEDGYVCVHENLRLLGINAPEKYTEAGKISKAWLSERLPVDTVVRCQTVLDHTEKYGRFLATLTRDGDATSLNDQLVASGNAFVWDGRGTRPLA